MTLCDMDLRDMMYQSNAVFYMNNCEYCLIPDSVHPPGRRANFKTHPAMSIASPVLGYYYPAGASIIQRRLKRKTRHPADNTSPPGPRVCSCRSE
ncbi:hypothetical protein LX36DRAFT_377490 [Colletotrichum falcatum]|nr:hypothetical protein LX36DRAFT_377490 [Colletotrichum falcatum]